MKRIFATCVVASLLAGCGGGPSAPLPTQSVPTAMSVDFTAFVKQLVLNQSDAARPVDVSTLSFIFADDENPAAFADILPPAS